MQPKAKLKQPVPADTSCPRLVMRFLLQGFWVRAMGLMDGQSGILHATRKAPGDAVEHDGFYKQCKPDRYLKVYVAQRTKTY